MDPNNVPLLGARGILRYGTDPAAILDFERAAQLGPSIPWPYFFLAHHRMVNDRFEECCLLCERALALPATDEIRASLLDWLGIAMAELGFPPASVRGVFEAAIRLDPAENRYRHNLRAFEEGEAKKSGRQWVRPSVLVVQEYGRAAYGNALQHEAGLAA